MPEKRNIEYEVCKNGCWEVTSHHISGDPKANYPQARIDGKTTRLHRYFFKLHKGPIPEGMCVCHRCDNTNCINPEHLFLGTHVENIRDAKIKGRFPRGTAHHWAKLNEEKAKTVKAMLKEGVLRNDIVKKLGISKATVSRVATHKSWAWV